MNNLTGIKVKLEIDEPWEKSETIVGSVFKVLQYKEKIYLLMLADKKEGIFILSERYAEEKFDDISLDKKVHVAIGFYNGKTQVTDNSIASVIDKAVYHGIGSIRLMPV